MPITTNEQPAMIPIKWEKFRAEDDALQRESQECRRSITESQIDAVAFYREMLRIEQEHSERLEELNRLLLNLFDGYGYTFRDALDGVKLLLEKARRDG